MSGGRKFAGMRHLHRFRWPLAFLTFLIAAWRSEGWHQSDEHFQLLEYAGYKLGMNTADELAWEFGERMRPALQVGIVYVLYRFFELFGEVDPFYFVIFLRLLSGALFVGVLAFAFHLLSPTLATETGRRQLFWLSFGLWFMVYAGVRFTSENWSGSCAALAVLLTIRERRRAVNGSGFGWGLAYGLLWGLAFQFRYQIAFAGVGYLLWIVVRDKRSFWEISGVVIGGFFTLIVAGGVDAWFYGSYVFPPWAYFEQNILAGKAATFGTDPFYQYVLDILLQGIPPFSLLFLVGIVGFWWWWPKSLITWVSVPFILAHCLVSHKELRFLFPLLPFLPYAVCVTWERLLGRGRGCEGKWFRWGRVAFWVVSTGLLFGYTFQPPIREIPAQRFVYRTYGEKTEVYYAGRSLWKHAYQTRFYQASGLNLIEVDDPSDSRCAGAIGNCVYITTERDQDERLRALGHERVYGGYPEWMRAFNFGDWMRKSRFYFIYEYRGAGSGVIPPPDSKR